MKFTTKCASALVVLMAVSTVGSVMVSADEVAKAEAAKSLTSTGTVTVEEATDTDDKDPGVVDPENPDVGPITPTDPVDKNENKGPLKVERVSKLNFQTIKPKAGEITQFAKSVALEDGGKRGAMVQFADVRADIYGYELQASMTQQFTSDKDRQLKGSTITYNNGIMRAADGNGNNAPTFTKKAGIELGEDGIATTVVTASDDSGKEEGKGRYILEFGQSDDYEGESKGTAEESVLLTIPTKTASNMQKGTYEAKITWSLVTAP